MPRQGGQVGGLGGLEGLEGLRALAVWQLGAGLGIANRLGAGSRCVLWFHSTSCQVHK